jgi:hypothetical protein
MNNFSEKASFVWSVANLVRGSYRPNWFKSVMQPIIVLIDPRTTANATY